MTKRGEAQRFLAEAVAYTGTECLLWPFSRTSGGYGWVHCPAISGSAPRVVCALVYGRPPLARMDVAHSCGNTLCVAPAHLRWATRTENQADRVLHGTHNRGERHGMAKLTVADVRIIRSQLHRMNKDLAAEYGVAPSAISHIRTRHTWRWLED